MHLNLRAHLLDLAISFLPGLSSEEIKVLYTAIKPALQVRSILDRLVLQFVVFV